MSDKSKTITQIRKGLVDQFVLATGQFVGEIDRILSTFGVNNENVINGSSGMFAYFTVRMALINATENLSNAEFSYVDEYRDAVVKCWASGPEMIRECEKDLAIATKLFSEVLGNCISIGNFEGRKSLHEIPIKLCEEFVGTLFYEPIKDEKVKGALLCALSNFHRERFAELKTFLKEAVARLEGIIDDGDA